MVEIFRIPETGRGTLGIDSHGGHCCARCAFVMRTGYLFLALNLALAAFGQSSNTAARVEPEEVRSQGVWNRVLLWIEPAPSAEAGRPERVSEFLMSTVGPIPLFGEAAGAGIGQWANWPKEWGQGWGAFGKRFGSNLAYNGIRQTVTYGGSLALGEDTRYFASRDSGWWPRTRHALVSTFTARHSDGKDSFSYSATGGVIAASALSSIWGPASWKGPGNIAENAGISFASTAGVNLVREFLPDILHRPRR